MDDKKSLIRFGVFYAVIFATVAVIIPFLPIYLKLRGYTPSKIGLILGAMEIFGVAAPFLVSNIADRFGRYRGMIALLVALTLTALFLLDRSSVFPLVMAAAALYGLAMKPIVPMTDALTGRSLKDSSGNYGRVRVWGTVSFIVVSIILQLTALMDTDSPRRLFSIFFLAFAVLLAAVPVLPEVRKSGGDETSSIDAKMPRKFFLFLLIGFLGHISFGVYQAFGSLYFAEIVGVSRVSGLFALASFCEIPVMIFGGRILRGLNHRRMLMISFASGLLRMIVLAVFPSPLPVVLSQLTHAFNYGFFLIAGVDWVNRVIPEGRRALGMGMFTAFTFNATQLVVSFFGGFILEYAGFAVLFTAAAFFPLIALILLAVFGSALRLDDRK